MTASSRSAVNVRAIVGSISTRMKRRVRHPCLFIFQTAMTSCTATAKESENQIAGVWWDPAERARFRRVGFGVMNTSAAFGSSFRILLFPSWGSVRHPDRKDSFRQGPVSLPSGRSWAQARCFLASPHQIRPSDIQFPQSVFRHTPITSPLADPGSLCHRGHPYRVGNPRL